MSDNFLGAPCNKLLILSDTNRMVDKKLLIGQMQGKYQLSMLTSATGNHAIHEDHPQEIASLLRQFWDRFSKPITLPTPSKVQ